MSPTLYSFGNRPFISARPGLLFILMVGIVLVILAPYSLFAVQAKEAPSNYTQPDGTTITLRLHGDEFVHWAETTDGYTILSDRGGAYEYAALDRTGQLVFSGIIAHDPAFRTAEEEKYLKRTDKGLFFSSGQVEEMKMALTAGQPADALVLGGFPATGTRKLLVILANFSNTATTYTQAAFDNYTNQVNFNGTGSFRDYYLEVSYGQLVVNSTVTVWVTLPNPHDYYGPNVKWGEFAFDAITAADNQTGINFAEYDNNLDGTVDGITIIHQGQGQEETGNIADIWSHSWDLISAGYTAAQRTFDGVLVNGYSTVPERNATGISTIGVMCHEFGHTLGAPDFYDTDYSLNGYYTGTGRWDVMAGGSWNGVAGTKPAHHNAWTRFYFNWTTPQTLTAVQQVTLRNAQLFPDVIRYNTTNANEYFLCENRQQTGFDAGIPGHGLIIYHVDGNYVTSHLGTNNINTSSHQGLYPVCASASGNPTAVYGNINSTGCSYPGTSCKTSFTDVTTPCSLSWSGTPSNFPVTNIAEYTSIKEIHFCFISCNTAADPATFTSSAISTNQINLTWTPNASADPVMVAWSTSPIFGTPVAGTTYPAGSAIPGGGTVLCSGTATSASHSNLNSNTTYYYKAWSVLTGNVFSNGILTNSTTLCGTISTFPWSEDFESNGTQPGCWSQEQVNNSGLSWLFTAGNGATNPAAAHGGSYNACLKDKTTAANKTRLLTPFLDLSQTFNPQLSFWHTQPVWGSDQDELLVYYRNTPNGTWTLLASYTSSVATWTQETISLPGASSNYSIAFEGNARFGYGICLDDIVVGSNCTSPVPVSVSITPAMNPVYQGTAVTVTATAVNGGSMPLYQWKVGNVNIQGATNDIYNHYASDNEEITCQLTSSQTCVSNNTALSNPVVLQVIPLISTVSLENQDMTGAQCFNAAQSITVAGNGSTFTLEPGSDVTLIAGQQIRLLPGVHAQPGSHLTARINTDGNYCPASISPAPSPAADTLRSIAKTNTNEVSVYPNPTTGVFTVDPGREDTETTTEVDIYSITGRNIVHTSITPGTPLTFSLSNQPAGVYLVRATCGTFSGSARIVRQ